MNNYFHVAGMLRPGVMLDQANAQLKLAAAEYTENSPKPARVSSFAFSRSATASSATRASRCS